MKHGKCTTVGRVDSSRALSCAQVFIVGARGNRQSVETRAHGENTSGSTIVHNVGNSWKSAFSCSGGWSCPYVRSDPFAAIRIAFTRPSMGARIVEFGKKGNNWCGEWVYPNVNIPLRGKMKPYGGQIPLANHSPDSQCNSCTRSSLIIIMFIANSCPLG